VLKARIEPGPSRGSIWETLQRIITLFEKKHQDVSRNPVRSYRLRTTTPLSSTVRSFKLIPFALEREPHYNTVPVTTSPEITEHLPKVVYKNRGTECKHKKN
jgi:hypothetical protein